MPWWCACRRENVRHRCSTCTPERCKTCRFRKEKRSAPCPNCERGQPLDVPESLGDDPTRQVMTVTDMTPLDDVQRLRCRCCDEPTQTLLYFYGQSEHVFVDTIMSAPRIDTFVMVCVNCDAWWYPPGRIDRGRLIEVSRMQPTKDRGTKKWRV